MDNEKNFDSTRSEDGFLQDKISFEPALTEQPTQERGKNLSDQSIELKEGLTADTAFSQTRQDSEDAIKELRELASSEAEQWDYMPKPPRRVKKHPDHPFLKVFIPFAIAFVVLFGATARIVFGKGWTNRLFSKEPETKVFTLPIAKYPELDAQFYQPDGRYTVEGVYEAVSPSIVTIEAYTEGDAFSAFGQGSGIIMSSDGYIITNAHVVEQATLAIKVRLKSGTEYSATLIGSDIKSDIAVIKIDAKDLPAAQFGDSDKVTVGEQVVAIGSPAGLEGTVTTGIASGIDRMIRVEQTNISMSCIQIDAALNPGNSGGALVNMWGQVIGITSSKLDALEYDNIGFAIEMSAAKNIIEELMEHGAVIGRPRIGITFYEISDAIAEIEGTPAGLCIAGIDEDCDIANTELQLGDYITEVNGVKVRSSDDVYAIILELEPGDTVSAHVIRELPSGNIKEFDISFKLMTDNSFVEEDQS